MRERAAVGDDARSTAWSAGYAAAVADTLRKCGVEEPEASLTAEAGTAVFRIAFERWTTAGDQRDLLACLTAAAEVGLESRAR